jgi:hypothetical protein
MFVWQKRAVNPVHILSILIMRQNRRRHSNRHRESAAKRACEACGCGRFCDGWNGPEGTVRMAFNITSSVLLRTCSTYQSKAYFRFMHKLFSLHFRNLIICSSTISSLWSKWSTSWWHNNGLLRDRFNDRWGLFGRGLFTRSSLHNSFDDDIRIIVTSWVCRLILLIL